MEWKSQIASIIAETEQNLSGISSRPAARAPVSFWPIPDREPLQTINNGSTSARSALGLESEVGKGMARAQELAGQAPDFGRSSYQRVLESVKFELDVRGSLAQKQLEAVREELNAGLHEAERKWLEVAKQIQASVSGQLESERALRAQNDKQLTRLQESAASSHQETLRMVSEFQNSALQHSEMMRRLEQELSMFKADMEARLGEEGKRISSLAVRAKDEDAATLSNSAIQKIDDLERALLHQRDFNRDIDSKVGALRGERGSSSAFEAVVQRALSESAAHSDAACSALDEKVKECGKLIVRMGTELMEETKRRQQLEADVHEIRMRLAGLEAVGRPSPASCAGIGAASGSASYDPYNTYSEFGGGFGADTLGGGGLGCGAFDSISAGLHECSAQQAHYAAAAAAADGLAAGLGGAGAGFAPPLQTPTYDGYATGMGPKGGLAHGGGCAAALSSAYSGCGGDPSAVEGLAQTWKPQCAHVVDERLRALTHPPPSTAAKPTVVAQSVASAQAPLSSSSSYSALQSTSKPSSTPAAALRLSRQELDARVQQILGRHGQSLSDYPSLTPAPNSARHAVPASAAPAAVL